MIPRGREMITWTDRKIEHSEREGKLGWTAREGDPPPRCDSEREWKLCWTEREINHRELGKKIRVRDRVR